MRAKRPSPSASRRAAAVGPLAQTPTSAVVGKLPHRRARGTPGTFAVVSAGTP